MGIAESIAKDLQELRRQIDLELNQRRQNNIPEHDRAKRYNYFKQEIAAITLVKGVPFYGYDYGWRLYAKIYYYNPESRKNITDVLLKAGIMGRSHQPCEARLNYEIQFLMDYNLYGCGYMECDETKLVYRRNLDGLDSEDEDSPPPEDPTAQSHSGWEIDIQAHRILNRSQIKPRSIHTEFRETDPLADTNFKYVHSLDELWKAYNNELNTQNIVRNLNTSVPSTERGVKTEPWSTELDYRNDIKKIMDEHKNSVDGEDIERIHIPNEKLIPTAFESVDYLATFYAPLDHEYTGEFVDDSEEMPIHIPKPSLPIVPSGSKRKAGTINNTPKPDRNNEPPDKKSRETEQEKHQDLPYTRPFYGNRDDVPSITKEYGGERHRLYAKDHYHDRDNPQRPNKGDTKTVWKLASKPPTRTEALTWAAENDSKRTSTVQKNSYEQKGRRYYHSQIEGPTQKPIGRPTKKADQHTKKSDDMSVMGLEIHVNTRGTLKPDPKTDPITCMFYRFHSPVSGLIITGIITSEEHFTEKIFCRFSGVDILVEKDEKAMIMSLIDLVRTHDPDILVGYEVHLGSWGYVNDRTTVIMEAEGRNLLDELARVKMYDSEGKKRQNDWGYRKASALGVIGRHVINIWRAMRGELTLLGYSIENVAFHLLKKRVPSYSHEDLTEWFTERNSASVTRVLQYYITKVSLDLEILERQEYVARTSEHARLIGLDFKDIIARGSQIKVESLMFRIAKPESYILVSPTPEQVGKQNAIECKPLIMEPHSNFYTSPVVVLDFQSLYPSIMLAYNYCYSTCLGKVVPEEKLGVIPYKTPEGVWKKLTMEDIIVSPNGIMYVKPHIRKSLLAKMLSEVLDTRVMIKSRMKSAAKDDPHLYQKLNSQQLALKLTANVTYGYTSATFSGRMPCVEIADSIVQSGRETLEKAIQLIHTEFSQHNATVIYGDTDSLFILLPQASRSSAFTIGSRIAERVTQLNPAPIKLKFEKVYLPCVLLAMKRYVGFSFEHPGQTEPKFDAKGIETVRRDGAPVVQKMQERALKELFRTGDVSKVKAYCIEQWGKIQREQVGVGDFVFAKEVKMGTYTANAVEQPAAKIYRLRKEEDGNNELQYGERVPYVVVYDGENPRRVIDRVVEVPRLLGDETLWIDTDYYIRKKIIPPLARIFNLIGADVAAWYEGMPKYKPPRRIIGGLGDGNDTKDPKKERGVTLDSYYKAGGVVSCLHCKKPMEKGKKMCKQCTDDRGKTFYQIKQSLTDIESTIIALETTCRSCTGTTPRQEIACQSLDCKVYFKRIRETSKLKVVKANADEAFEVLKVTDLMVKPPQRREKRIRSGGGDYWEAPKGEARKREVERFATQMEADEEEVREFGSQLRVELEVSDAEAEEEVVKEFRSQGGAHVEPQLDMEEWEGIFKGDINEELREDWEL
ncbi:hypothetical protein FPQ18DRAFT_386572 [Pyronema domesticum]|nr:hypothetical protein FPQ18DRAFT_386572 [Pyronema domesticum]